ncbi:TetR family transcriptional regulator C-terminal domain-containing protein [Paracoccus sp. TRP]|uniref:TetR family transcriptional regulator C-terminal domain-containing protein n=1 Tax=Paracoccus sp. TRP TaxID=412597 RepID=UPI000225F10D|nr:TetR family transcriptional regulator C-terminal domain-containing protein [Paracoccus sp. TRP]
MKGWDDLTHCRILFELLAEAGRNERIRAILRENTDGVRALLMEALKAGQSRGEVDPDLDPKHTSAVLVVILDAAPMLPLMASDIGFKESRKLITTMVSRFLRPAT